jgi:hypothetical protein
MKAPFKPTNAHLEIEANNLERYAKESLAGWVILGQFEKYSEALDQVLKLRHALTIKGLKARREFLGWE